MPVTSSDLQADLLKKALLGCAAVATVVTAFSLLIDPTSAMNSRLDAIEPVFGKALIADAGRTTAHAIERLELHVGRVVQRESNERVLCRRRRPGDARNQHRREQPTSAQGI